MPIKKEWISVDEQLPNDGEIVLIYAGNYPQEQKYDIAKFSKGISISEREQMKDGNLYAETVEHIHYNGDLGNPIYTSSERWKVETFSDEGGNNQKPYSWRNPPMEYFGQYVTYWMPLPDKPITQTKSIKKK